MVDEYEYSVEPDEIVEDEGDLEIDEEDGNDLVVGEDEGDEEQGKINWWG
jgi:hypothetical protein